MRFSIAQCYTVIFANESAWLKYVSMSRLHDARKQQLSTCFFSTISGLQQRGGRFFFREPRQHDVVCNFGGFKVVRNDWQLAVGQAGGKLN